MITFLESHAHPQPYLCDGETECEVSPAEATTMPFCTSMLTSSAAWFGAAIVIPAFIADINDFKLDNATTSTSPPRSTAIEASVSVGPRSKTSWPRLVRIDAPASTATAKFKTRHNAIFIMLIWKMWLKMCDQLALYSNS